MKQVCICGGGNLGHVVTGFLASHGDCEVSLLTRHPERWQQQLEITTPDGEVLKGRIKAISSNPAEVGFIAQQISRMAVFLKSRDKRNTLESK